MIKHSGMSDHSQIIVVMPAFNAAKTLLRTWQELPHALLERVIVVDDASTDETVAIASQLQLQLFIHKRNRGYGANQKTCYKEALQAGATIVVMVHPDYQYDPRLLPALILPIQQGRADVVLGSRFLGESPVAQGMPWWKFLGNRALTRLENAVMGLSLSELHTGYRAFRSEALQAVPFTLNSDHFLFDQEIIAQLVVGGFRIGEVAVPTRYMPEASSVGFWQSVRYGFSILFMLLRVLAQRHGLYSQRWLAVTPAAASTPAAQRESSKYNE